MGHLAIPTLGLASGVGALPAAKIH